MSLRLIAAPGCRMLAVGRHTVRLRDDGMADDLALLRADRALRLRCILAGLAPTVAYTAALVALHDTGLWADLLVLPVTVGGVLVGALLDAAHRRS